MSSLKLLNQKEYLKKYLGLGKAPGEKKKKKKKDKDSDRRLKIIDDDLDDYMSNEIQMDIEAADEDAPQIVAVIDDRPPSLRVDEKTNTLLWKPLGEDNDVKPEIPKKMSSFQLKKTALENKSNILSSKKMSKDFLKKKSERNCNSINLHITEFKKEDPSSSQMHTDARKSPLKDKYGEHSNSRKESSDLSPLRTIKKEPSDDNDNDRSPPIRRDSTHISNELNQDAYHSKKIKQEPSDNAFSPPTRFHRQGNDSDVSPPRRDQRHNNDSDVSPPRRVQRHNNDSDVSPPRRGQRHNNNSEVSPPRSQRHNNDSDVSPPRRNQKQNNDSDISPPRRKQYNSTSKNRQDISPPRRGGRHSSDSDTIPHLRTKQKDSLNTVDTDISPSRKKHERRYRYHDEDISPPRKRNASNYNSSPRQEHSRNQKDKYCSDRTKRNFSPPRRKRAVEERHLTPPRRIKDLSPPRKKSRSEKESSPLRKIKTDKTSSPDRRKRDRQKGSRWGDWSPDHNETESSGKPEKTMSGKRAGLQSAKELSKEIATLKEKENRVFQNMSEEVSGRNATTVVRGQKPKDPEEEAQKLKKERELKEKYDRWGKGLKQVENENQRMADQLYEMSKPLARYADDEDLEKYLKEQEREGDPMLNYIRKKKKKKNVDSGIPEKPMYMGEFMPNRYGIRPGYRWDGVDRSNGYENRWYEKFNARKAVQEEAFKWSTEDM